MASKRPRDTDTPDAAAINQTPAKKLWFSPSSKPMHIVVDKGFSARELYVHRDLLVRHSKYFKDAAQSAWGETKDSVVTLHEEDPTAFSLFVEFVYSGMFSIGDAERSEAEKTSRTYPELTTICRAWLLGDTLLSTSFQDAIADGLCDWLIQTGIHPTTMFRTVYNRDDSPRGLKRLLVDIAVFTWADTDFANIEQNKISTAFLSDCMIRARQCIQFGTHNKTPWVKAACKYHDHGDDKPCYKTLF